jgi:hypothetical protein
MQTKTKSKARPTRAKISPKSRVQPPAKSPARDDRPIMIIGRDACGKVVAQDRTSEHWKAKQIAAAWKSSGWVVEIIETGPANGPQRQGAGSRVEPSASILGHPGASV